MNALRAILIVPSLAAALACLAGCGGSPQAGKKAEPPPEPVSGRTALYRMFTMARGQWSKDALVVRLTSMPLSGPATPDPGFAYAWEAVFAVNGEARSYTYSEIEQLPAYHKGAFAGPSQAMSGKPFYIDGARIDSDAAYKAAVAKDAKDASKNQSKPLIFVLELSPKFGEPVWRVVWGESLSTAAFSVFVGASTGQVLDTLY